MRPIKFRYKFKVTSCFDRTDPGYFEDFEYEIFTLEQIEKGVVQKYCDDFYAKIISRNQFIGFSDEGGREIYEGDGLFFDVSGISGKVEWDDDRGGFMCRNKPAGYSHEFGIGDGMWVSPWVLNKKGNVIQLIWKVGEQLLGHEVDK